MRDHLGGPGSIILMVMTADVHIKRGDVIQAKPRGPHSLYQLSVCTNHFLVPLGLWYQQIICTDNLIVL